MKELSDKEVLQAAIQKAIDGGWKPFFDWPLPALWAIDDDGIYSVHDGYERNEVSLEEIIFNHDFAKALWGKEHKPFSLLWTRFEDREIPFTRPLLPKDDPKQIAWAAENHQIQSWEWHLQKMVIADDRIDYLRRHL